MLIKPKSYKEVAYDKIKKNIINGVFKPGEVLNERNLSEEFGISRTPIREAIQQLSYEGWIINERYKKNVVREFTLDDIIKVQKVRSSLEILAISESIENISDKDLETLEDIIKEQSEKTSEDQFDEYITLDRMFHNKLYELSDNSYLIDMIGNINDIVRSFGIMALNYPRRQEATIIEHTAILKGLREKDVESAKKAMETHMNNTLEAIKYIYIDN